MTHVRELLGSKTALEAADITSLQKSIHMVMQYINDHPGTAALLLHFGDSHEYLQGHTGNVFYVSLLVGNTIRDYIYRERQRSTRTGMVSARYGMNLTPLALGCLFHDLGMLAIEHLYDQPGELNDEDTELVKQHPEAALKLLPDGFDAVSKMVIRTHHENCDGSGYPGGVPGESLHIFSRVVRAADALDAATSQHVYRKAKSAARVLWEMSIGPYKEHYDQTIVKIMMALVQPFPIGAKVKLSNGYHGVVVRHNRKRPFHPTIIVAFDETGKKLKKKDLSPPINLAECEDMTLKEFAGDDLSCIYQGAGSSEEVWGLPESEKAKRDMSEKLFELAYP
jgi:HD-GYP domain-containing protein (c-di-GMP phosphodiesterase class II)